MSLLNASKRCSCKESSVSATLSVLVVALSIAALMFNSICEFLPIALGQCGIFKLLCPSSITHMHFFHITTLSVVVFVIWKQTISRNAEKDYSAWSKTSLHNSLLNGASAAPRTTCSLKRLPVAMLRHFGLTHCQLTPVTIVKSHKSTTGISQTFPFQLSTNVQGTCQ